MEVLVVISLIVAVRFVGLLKRNFPGRRHDAVPISKGPRPVRR